MSKDQQRYHLRPRFSEFPRTTKISIKQQTKGKVTFLHNNIHVLFLQAAISYNSHKYTKIVEPRHVITGIVLSVRGCEESTKQNLTIFRLMSYSNFSKS